MSMLAGVRILDFTAHAAGPFCTHLLSLLGAECIKVESAARPDIFRRPHPVYGRVTAATFDQVAANKRSIRLNLKHPDAAALAARVAVVSNVVAESFRPGVAQRLGVGYAAMRAARQDIVMVSVSASGQFGPDSQFSGYAPMFGAWGGLGYLTGYEDGPPVEMRHVMDHSVGLHAAIATVATLWRCRSTGVGGHVDVSARDVAAALVGDALLFAAAGSTPTRQGNDQHGVAPHGVYPTADSDRWIAISVTDDEQWARLATVLNLPELARDRRFRNADVRYEHRRELDEIVSRRTAEHHGEALVAALQSSGVPAHMSWTQADIAADEHLRQRGTIVEIEEPDAHSQRAAVGAPIRFSRCADVGLRSGTPGLGEGEEYVYGELLGLSAVQRRRMTEDHLIY
jgi:crotonobetainyl-CoA:carnitine CoA-transferase CaiB-like acyl-CoA transferase